MMSSTVTASSGISETVPLVKGPRRRRVSAGLSSVSVVWLNTRSGS